MLHKMHKLSHNHCEKFGSLSLLVSRIVLGIVFAGSGWWKLTNLEQAIGFFQSINIPMASLQAPFVGALELVGGILLILGFMTRILSLPLMIIMVVAILTAHSGEITSMKELFKEDAFLYFILLFIHLGIGSGKYSVDHKVFH